MTPSKSSLLDRAPALLAALLALAAPALARAAATGLVCTSGASPNPTFVLTASAGSILLPDGNTMYMWGYAPAGRGFQHPGPVLCVSEGDTVTVVLRNDLPEDVSIVFPGQEGVTANGAPSSPVLDGGGTLRSLAPVAAANGGSVSYSFVASSPGTFLYESGTEPQKQVRLGLFGTLVVRPLAGADHLNQRADSQFMPEEEFLVLLSEIDPYLNWSVEAGMSFDLTGYHPRYWLINGRGFPDSIADNDAPYLPDQPYGALARIHPHVGDHPGPGAIRYLNVGTEPYPFHPHGNNGLVVARDGRPLEGPAAEDLSFEKFAIDIGPGQTWDVLFRYYDAEAYAEGTNPVPVVIPPLADQTIGMFYGGSPYLGVMGPMPPGMSTLNACGEFYIISHNHALFQLTAWGATMSGPATYLRVDPPLPNACP
jgi:FtsP/CotA-like multicopper oxidase with cupredoxin domain